MYKSRGKPEDPWNKEAAKQEKDLAEAIQVNQIQRNGVDQHLERFLWSPTARQKEIARRQNNYEQFRMIYQDKLRKSNTSSCLLKEKKVADNCNRQNRLKRNVNRAQTTGASNCCTKFTNLKAPLNSTKTVKMQVPAPYQEAAIFRPPRLGTAQTLPFLHKLKEIEKLEEKLFQNKKVSTEGGDQADFLKELQEAHIEVDVGNAQLEEINRILKAAKLHNGKIWNVVRTLGPVKEGKEEEEEEEPLQESRSQTNPKEKTKKVKEKEQILSKKNRLLLTLNDVNQRIQKMQAKFFSDNRPRYRSVKTKNFIRSNYSTAEVEVLYENRNYDSLGDKRKLDNLKLPTNSQEPCNDNFARKLTTENITSAETGTSPYNSIYKALPEVDFRVPLLNLDNSDDIVREFTDQNTSPINYDTQPSPTIFIDNGKNEMCEQENSLNIPPNTNQRRDKDISAQSAFESNLQESILKSDFLMKEFDINPKDIHIDILRKMYSMLENKTSNRKSSLPENIIQRMKNERIEGDYAKVRNPKLCTPSAHYVLKDTLYCTE